MKTFKEMITEKEFDKDLIAKLAKKAFGKDFDKVEYSEDTKTINIVLNAGTQVVRWSDLKSFDINSNTYEPGDIHFHRGSYVIEVKIK